MWDKLKKDIEEMDARLKKDLMPGGKGDNKPDSAFKPKQLKTGTSTEQKEHGLDSARAKEVAKDHLTEKPDYYNKEMKKAWPQGATETQTSPENEENKQAFDITHPVNMDTMAQSTPKGTPPTVKQMPEISSKKILNNVPKINVNDEMVNPADNFPMEEDLGNHNGYWPDTNPDLHAPHSKKVSDVLANEGTTANHNFWYDIGKELTNGEYDRWFLKQHGVNLKDATVGVPTPNKGYWDQHRANLHKEFQHLDKFGTGSTQVHAKELEDAGLSKTIEIDRPAGWVENGKIKVQGNDVVSGEKTGTHWHQGKAGVKMGPQGHAISAYKEGNEE